MLCVMKISFDENTLLTLPGLVFLIVFGCWVAAFILMFSFRKKPGQEKISKKDSASVWGIGSQGLAYGILWIAPRLMFSPPIAMSLWVEILWAAVTVAIAVFSVILCLTASRTLGPQWTYVARIIEGHKLVTQGPYGIVRNPIYLGMFGMLLATGLAVSRWWVLCFAITLFLIGSAVRIRSEEKLLQATFGSEFEAYKHHVPAMLPRIWPN
jgi:protein-S-isoprenylcysteine O-methyltransferase Ste14